MTKNHLYQPNLIKADVWHNVRSTVITHFWFKCFGTTGFTFVFFSAYFFLLNNPAFPITTIPATPLDDAIKFEPLALPLYLTLWIYVSLPPALMTTRRGVIEYGAWMSGLCVSALIIFYFWPSTIPPTNINWNQYPLISFIKGFDASGNACPSLHVATAVFSFFWLQQRLLSIGLGYGSLILNVCWCAAIIYSTMATKQHMAIDVIAGIGLALVFSWAHKIFR